MTDNRLERASAFMLEHIPDRLDFALEPHTRQEAEQLMDAFAASETSALESKLEAVEKERDEHLKAHVSCLKELAMWQEENTGLRAEVERYRRTANEPCPCVLADESCHPCCTCVSFLSSVGCYACATYGSDEQRKEAANHLVGLARASRHNAYRFPTEQNHEH